MIVPNKALLNQMYRKRKIQQSIKKFKPLHKDANPDEWDSISKFLKEYRDKEGRGISDEDIRGFGRTYLYNDPDFVRNRVKNMGWNPYPKGCIDYYTWNQQ